MSIDDMRIMVSKVYPGQKWKDKVKKMPDYQILAIYQRMVNARQIKV